MNLPNANNACHSFKWCFPPHLNHSRFKRILMGSKWENRASLIWLLSVRVGPVCLPSPALKHSPRRRSVTAEVCHSSHPCAGDIRVTFSSHCGIVGGFFIIESLPGRNEEEQAESADRWREDPRWEWSTAPAVQPGPAWDRCWVWHWVWGQSGWGRSSVCDDSWQWHGRLPWGGSWWAPARGITRGWEGTADRVLKSSGSVEEVLFTWTSTDSCMLEDCTWAQRTSILC